MITDLTYLKTMLNGDDNFIQEMVEIFKVQVAEYSLEMPAAWSEGKYEDLAKIAHKAKSSVAVMGMMKEKEMLEDVEVRARNGQDLDSIKILIEKIIENLDRAILELDEQLNNI